MQKLNWLFQFAVSVEALFLTGQTLFGGLNDAEVSISVEERGGVIFVFGQE